MRRAELGMMAGIISRAILRRDTGHPVFHGCVDWHSAVHGHWALLRIARATGAHAREAVLADRSMTPRGIAKEAAILARHPEFEMPYGRAWFLRLAIEHAALDPRRLRPMADAVAASLLAHFGRFPPSPCTHEYASNAWALVQLHAYARHTGDARALRRVDGWIRRHFLETGIRLGFGSDRSAPEFLSPFGAWAYLVARTQDAATLGRFLARHPVADADLAPVTTLLPHPHGVRKRPLPASHQLGMNWSRAWALKALGRAAPRAADRRRFAGAYAAHVAAGMRHHREYAGDVMLYDHWIPQFAVYALTG